MKRRLVSDPRGLILLILAVLAFGAVQAQDRDPLDPMASYYWPYSNNPPGAPPNYNLVDSSYFQGVPVLPDPLTNNVGGYYIWNDTAAGKWNIANFNFTRGNSLSQFHGCILVLMDQDPQPGVNFWAQGFELTPDYLQNDRWGWVKWPDSIYPGLYEIWWDYTVDYSKPNDTGDYRDTMAVVVAGCAVDFNLWTSGVAAGVHFDAENIYLGDDKTPMDQIPGFTDTYAGVTDQYQSGNAVNDPNLTRFTPVGLPGATYNVNGLIMTGTTYGDRYAGSWAYEGNGIQFSTLFCPPYDPPNFLTPPSTDTLLFCGPQAIYDTVVATDPNPYDTLQMTLLSGPGSLTFTPSTTPATGYYSFTPTFDGLYTAVFEITDQNGDADTLTVNYYVIFGSAPVVQLPPDSTIFSCDPIEICVPLEISDADCDVTSVVTSPGTYAGTASGFDQIGRLNELGGTVIQIGGGAPGTVLTDATDFVPPINSQSGVDVTLPNFAFATSVVDYGSFPNGIQPGNSADHLLGEPTDLTFTAPGAGGPDGGDGDGSIAFGAGNYCVLGFGSAITTCSGSNADLFLFTNTDGGGNAELTFRKNGTTVYTLSQVLPSGAAGSGMGGVTLDLPDGIEFNELRIQCLTGILEIDAVGARTASSSSTSDICFTADTTGVYAITATATDACGNIGDDVMYVTFTRNSPPTANAGADIAVAQCSPAEICFGVTFSDVDGNLAYGEKTSGPGTLSGGQICFTPTGAGVYSFVIHAVDSCALDDYDTVNVTVTENSAPVAVDPDTISVFQCAPEQLCYTFTATDPDSDPLTWSLVAGAGAISPSGEFCFTPTLSGIYGAAVAVSDTCGAADTVTIHYVVQVNSAPVAADPGAAVDLSLCAGQQVCYDFSATDVNGGPLVWTKLSGDGTVSSAGQWCFDANATGTYTVMAAVTDSCGLADTVSHTYNVTVNTPPSIAFGADTSLSLCTPQEICLSYTVADDQGLAGLTETMLSGYGAIDTAANQICFTPTTAGNYMFIAEVTDDCGASDVDTISVSVSFGASASIVCPEGPISVALCSPDEVCQALTISPAGATVTTSFGSFSGGQLCFNADTAGQYAIDVIASTACGADTCTVVFDVTIGTAAQINCPAPGNVFLCGPDQVCVPVGIMGPGASVTVSPIGTFSGGTLCFDADTAGHYEIEIIAATSCGADTCTVVRDVAFNAPPVATDPASPIDTFLCTAGQICYQFAATDSDGGALTWSRLSGNGSVSGAGEWCFNANTAGSYSVTAVVADTCGAADTVTLTYNVTLNAAPTLALGNDTTLFQCSPGVACLFYTATDPNNNITNVQILSGDPSATVNMGSSQICFNPAGPGVFTFIVQATDACGLFDIDTLTVTNTVNSAPVVDAGDDVIRFDCAPAQVCVPVSITDVDNNLTGSSLVSGPGTFDGSQICFTPAAAGDYTFIVEATDLCGLTGRDTVTVFYALNSPPTADAGADQSLDLCAVQEICWAAGCSDPDNNLATCALTSAVGTYDGTQICFTPDTSGSYLFVLEATDDCGETDVDSIVIDVSINSAPMCVVPNDTTIAQCTAAEVCLPAYANDADGNLVSCQIISGPGSLSGGNWCYTPTSSQTVTVVMECTDACGATCQTDFTVTFQVNGAPSIAFGNDLTTALCASEEICLPYMAQDPNGLGTTTVTLVSGPGTLDEGNSQVCFTPTVSGTSTFIIRIADNCGATDEDTINVTVTFNTPPVANAGADQTLFLCDGGTEICWPAGCSDVDDNLTDCMFTGPGLYDGTSICFTPNATGVYQFTLEALDECGATMTDTVTITVTLNQPPLVQLPEDYQATTCGPEEICFNYSASDVDGSFLTEAMVAGYGTLDTAANEICFTPPSAGNYQFIVAVTDSCGATTADTVVVTVNFNEAASIDCPAGPIDVSLCAAEEVCYQFGVQPSGATVTTSFGTYANGELCFTADTSGVYDIEVIASAACGDDTCNMVFNVTIGSAAQIVCPDPQSIDICAPDTVCLPLTVLKRNETVTVSPIGYYSAGNVCFFADTSGHYELTVIASTECGADTCMLIADITINSAPVAVDPPAIDTFICGETQFCYDLSATDPDGDALTWSRLDGPGTVTGAQHCFTATAGGTYTITLVVTDPCGAADTVTLVYNVTLNAPPTIAFDGGFKSKLSRFSCDTLPICLPYTVTDPDDNVDLEELLSGVGTIDTTTNEVCFTPDTAGVYRFMVKATDACGAFDVDTLDVTVLLNSAPVADAGEDQTMFQCTPTQICWPASCTDVDGNLDSCYVLGGLGTYNGSTICFTPDTAGVYTLVLRSVDACGASDQDTVVVTITLNEPPVCQVPEDASFFQCVAAPVQLAVGGVDPDGNFDHCELVSGPGSISGGYWTYTPTGDQSATVTVMCVDSCGATCIDSFHVAFDVNTKPSVDLGDNFSAFMCQSTNFCIPYLLTDAENNIETVTAISPVGATIANSEICFDASLSSTVYQVIVEASDSCGAIGRDTITVTTTANHAPTLTLPPDFTVYLDWAGEVCFAVSADDVDDNLGSIHVNSIGSYDPQTGKVCFTADTSGVYCFTVTASDGCGAQVTKDICVTVQVDECLHVQVEKTHGSLQGQHEYVDVSLQGSGKDLGGFDLLIQYDPTALLFQAATPGDLIDDCGWEYFTYRQGADGNCSGCPSGLIRVVGVAETNNGANHPGCFLNGMTGSLATLDFLVTNDRTFECQYAPVRFFWVDCGDNSFASQSGDTLWISRRVFDFELAEITNTTYGLPGFFGAPDICLIPDGPGKPAPVRCVDFTNGGVDIVCSDSIDARGDINLNGQAYEISDAVLLSNYFVYGIGVFTVSVPGQTAASDVNADGIPLSVADLVYLIRVVTGDAPAMPKLDPDHAAEVDLSITDHWLAIESSEYRVGAIYLTIEGNVAPTLHADAANMELQYSFDGTVTRVLVYNLNGTSFLQTGRVLELPEGAKIKNIDIAAYDGFALSARVDALPDRFGLFQNYPNPFNPTTTIEFGLPHQSEWELKIINVLGQTVREFSGHDDAGFMSVEWDAGRFASGVYFYRLKAGEYSATKKMVLLK